MTIRVGILGTGFGYQVHFPIFRDHPDFEIGGIYGRNISKTKKIADDNDFKSFESWQELISNPNIDLIVITTPNHLHYSMAKHAIKNKKHVLIEKPLTTNSIEARELIRLSKEYGVKGAVAHEFRYIPERQKMREIVTSEMIGTIREIHGSYFYNYSSTPKFPKFDWQWDSIYDSGELSLGGVHHIDTLRFISNHEFHNLYGQLYTRVREREDSEGIIHKVRVDDGFSIVFEMENNITGSMIASNTFNPSGPTKISVNGENGTCYLEGRNLFYGPRDGEFEQVIVQSDVLEAKYNVTDWHIPPMYRLIDNLSKAIIDGIDCNPDLIDGWRNQQVIDAVRRSHILGTKVSLADFN